MRVYNIFDKGRIQIGVLFYFDYDKSFVIELSDQLDEYTSPIHFGALIKNKIYTVPRWLSKLWVTDRIIPPDRQNINSILKDNKIREYDEFQFLILSNGKCCQDNLYIEKAMCVPDYVEERAQRHIEECFFVDEQSFICIFRDNSIRKISLEELINERDVNKIIKIRELRESCKVSPGGFSITFNNSIDIPCDLLYKSGYELNITLKDLKAFVQKNILSTTESCEELHCSRQNLSYLASKKQITPIKSIGNTSLYCKGELNKSTW